MRFIAIFILVLLAKQVSANIVSEQLIDRACKRYNMEDCTLVRAIVWTETNYRSMTVLDTNNKNSFGPMQVQCRTAREVGLKFGCQQMTNTPLIGLRFGIEYLKKQLNRYGNLSDAVAAYNAGAAYRCREMRFDKTTKKILCYKGEYVNYDYVNKVTRRYKHLINIGEHDAKRTISSDRT